MSPNVFHKIVGIHAKHDSFQLLPWLLSFLLQFSVGVAEYKNDFARFFQVMTCSLRNLFSSLK